MARYGAYRSTFLLAFALMTGALVYFFAAPEKYYKAGDDQIVMGSLAIFFVFCWGFMVRYSSVPTKNREQIPYAVKLAELTTHWTSQGFLIFVAAAILNEKVLHRVLASCTDSRQSTPTIAAISFFAGSVALSEPSHINSFVINVLFLLSVVLRNYRNSQTSLYLLLLGCIGSFLIVVRMLAIHKVFDTRTKDRANAIAGMPTPSASSKKAGCGTKVIHALWEFSHQLNISQAVAFSGYYTIEGWYESLDLSESKFWIPLLIAYGAALIRLGMTRLFWSMVRKQLDAAPSASDEKKSSWCGLCWSSYKKARDKTKASTAVEVPPSKAPSSTASKSMFPAMFAGGKALTTGDKWYTSLSKQPQTKYQAVAVQDELDVYVDTQHALPPPPPRRSTSRTRR